MEGNKRKGAAFAPLFYFCEMTEEELKEMHERLVSKSYYQVEVVAIRFYHLKVYNEALNENCSSCVRESYDRLKKWYHGQIEKV